MNTHGNIILLGLKSSGKTTIGRFLGQALGQPWVDLDDLLTLEYKRRANVDPENFPLRFAKDDFAPRRIHLQHGETFFRQLEADAFFSLRDGGLEEANGLATSAARATTANSSTGFVLSTGGGFASNRLLRAQLRGNEGLFVWLRVAEDVLFQRMNVGGELPAFLGQGTLEQAKQRWAQIYKQRLADGLELAKLVVELGRLDTEAACKKTLNEIQELGNAR